MFLALELSGYCQATAVHAALGRWRWVTHRLRAAVQTSRCRCRCCRCCCCCCCCCCRRHGRRKQANKSIEDDDDVGRGRDQKWTGPKMSYTAPLSPCCTPAPDRRCFRKLVAAGSQAEALIGSADAPCPMTSPVVNEVLNSGGQPFHPNARSFSRLTRLN
jgi:hypothetical protein